MGCLACSNIAAVSQAARQRATLTQQTSVIASEPSLQT